MALGGYANHVARIDLSAGTVDYESINEDDARLYIGARGLGVKYLLDNGPQIDPDGPDNMLAFVNGPLTGRQLTRIVHQDHFWFAWAAFKPATRIYQGASG